MPVHFPEKKKPKPDKAKNLERLRKIHGEERFRLLHLPYIGNYKFPLNMTKFFVIDRSAVRTMFSFSPHSRLKCQNCGLFNRGTLCPPRLGNSYPHLATIRGARKWLRKAEYVYVFVWQNDGTKPWVIDWEDVAHLYFREISGRRLKGVEHASAKAITKFMKKLEDHANGNLSQHNAFAFIPGHCDLCARYCPIREVPKARCRKGGMPSMESIGVDVYNLLDYLGVDWRYPVMEGDHLTQVTMLVMREK